MNADVLVGSEESIVLLHLLSPAAECWVEEHVDSDAQWFGGGLVVEHRFAADLVSALCEAGLRVEVLR